MKKDTELPRKVNRQTSQRVSAKATRSDLISPVVDVLSALVWGYQRKVTNGQHERISSNSNRSIATNNDRSRQRSISDTRSVRSLPGTTSRTSSPNQQLTLTNREPRNKSRRGRSKLKRIQPSCVKLNKHSYKQFKKSLHKIPRYYPPYIKYSHKELKNVKYTFHKLCKHVQALVLRSKDKSSKKHLEFKSKNLTTNKSTSKIKKTDVRDRSRSFKRKSSVSSSKLEENCSEKKSQENSLNITGTTLHQVIGSKMNWADVQEATEQTFSSDPWATSKQSVDQHRGITNRQESSPKPFPLKPIIATEKRKGAYFTPYFPIARAGNVYIDAQGNAVAEGNPPGVAAYKRPSTVPQDRLGNSALDVLNEHANSRQTGEKVSPTWNSNIASGRPSTSPASRLFVSSRKLASPSWTTSPPQWIGSWGEASNLTSSSFPAVRSSSGRTLYSSPGGLDCTVLTHSLNRSKSRYSHTSKPDVFLNPFKSKQFPDSKTHSDESLRGTSQLPNEMTSQNEKRIRH